ncbi:acyltransferase family protein [Pseudomonas sp. HY7a-MNA-CIBAN-0227]|uniref:acyltransferase family protein n=1 Tax=Pseudomonas sp. HY7a-MNA-CIBAN-0227 TaxID=3140474 RepID=UPI003317593A
MSDLYKSMNQYFKPGVVDENTNIATLVEKRNDIEGLRALAVIAVILYHFNNKFLPGGFLGVDIFLVISGYIITKSILQVQSRGTFSLLQFFIARIKRIVPAYIVMLSLVGIAASILFVPKDYAFFSNSLTSALFFFSNEYFSKFGDYFSPSVYELPLLHTWSLAVEMQFYLIFPLVLMVLRFRHLRILSLLILASLTVYTEYKLRVLGVKQEVYFSLLARIPEFFIGVGLVTFTTTLSVRVANYLAGFGLAVLLICFFLIDGETRLPGSVALIPCIAVAIIIYSKSSLLNKLLSSNLLVWIGGLSYSLYLWHWPLLAFIRYYTQSYVLNQSGSLTFLFLLIVLAYISFRFVELPFRVKQFTRPKIFSALTVVLLTVMLSLALSLVSINGKLVKRLPSEFTQYASNANICHGHIVGDCIRGKRSEKKPLLLLGDSHGAQLNYFFDVVGNADGLAVRVITGSSCVTIPGFDLEKLPDWAQVECKAQIESAEKYIESSDVLIIAGMWQYQTQSPKFIEALTRFLNEDRLRTKKVFVIAQIPMFSSDFVRVNRFQNLGFSGSLEQTDDWKKANKKIEELVSIFPHVKYLNFSDYTFFTDAPFYNGVLMYSDSHHLNEIGSRLYGEAASPAFKDL